MAPSSKAGGVEPALAKQELLAADANLAPQRLRFAGLALAHNGSARELVDAALKTAVVVGETLL